MGGQLGEYVLLEIAGRGAGSVVYRAHRRGTPGRVVAVKEVDRPDAEALDRLRREGHILSALSHPAILPLIEVIEDDGRVGLVLPWAAGGTLADRLRSGPLPWPQVADLGARLADGLAAAHGAGVLHRDVSPTNILFGVEDDPRLADFGAARLRTDPDGPVVGTAPYLAPELVDGASPEARTDVYGLGAVLYECLAGRRPHDGDDIDAILRRAAHGDHPPLGDLAPDAPPELVAAVERAMAADPAERPASAQEVAGDLAVQARAAERARHEQLVAGAPVAEGTTPQADTDAAPDTADSAKGTGTRIFGPRPPAAPSDSASSSRRRRPAVAASAAVVVLVAAGIVVWLLGNGVDDAGKITPSGAQTPAPVTVPRSPAPLCDGQPAPADDRQPVDVDGRGCSLVVRVVDTTVGGAPATVIVLPAAAGDDLAGRYRVGAPDDVVVFGDWDCDGTETPALVRPDGEVFTFAGYGAVTAEPAGTVDGDPVVVTTDGCDRVASASLLPFDQ